MGLYASLSMAARSLAAQEYGLSVTGQNIANLNTPGYARRIVTLVSVPPADGGGVRALGAPAQRDALLEARIQQEYPAEQQFGAVADSLAVVERSAVTMAAIRRSFAGAQRAPTGRR